MSNLFRHPVIRTADDMRKWDMKFQARSDGKWYCARPLSKSGIFSISNMIERLKLTWMVFSGKADVLTWREE